MAGGGSVRARVTLQWRPQTAVTSHAQQPSVCETWNKEKKQLLCCEKKLQARCEKKTFVLRQQCTLVRGLGSAPPRHLATSHGTYLAQIRHEAHGSMCINDVS